MSKKTIFFIILIIVIGLIATGTVLYFIFRPTSGTGVVTENGGLPTDETVGFATPTPMATLAPEEQQKIHIISKGDVLAFWSASTTTLQYFKEDGFYEADFSVDPAKEEKKELGINFSNILEIKPSKTGKVLIKYVATGSSDATYSVLDIATHTLKNLDTNIKTAAWSPDGKTLIFYYSNSPILANTTVTNEQQYLGQMDQNLSNKKTLINFKASNDLLISWPSTTTAYIMQKSSGYVSQTVLAFDTKAKTFKQFVEGNGLLLKWDFIGNYGLLFMTQEKGSNPTLKLINKEAISLGTFPKVTLPEKCVFSNKSAVLYCAIPLESTVGAIWPDDYYMGAFNQEEAIYKIDLQTMEATPLIDKAIFEIQGIDLSKDETQLIFFDKISENLYELKLQ
ncbi:MAG TPA: hypothetical protein PLQ44_02385 [Candidatus Paceibacterota bacterium]|nr:hypothetical protein [Candidatus Paceibacterota bacterium]HPT40427.1 hypothetical protein [Candidatus Paceibacterota bacterium]